MKTAIPIKMFLFVLAVLLSQSCGNRWRGTTADNAGTKVASNDSGELPKSYEVHNHLTN